MCSYFFFATYFSTQKRVTEKSKTLTDNIFFKNFEFTTIFGDITY